MPDSKKPRANKSRSLRVDSHNTLRVDSHNTLRYSKHNAIVISEEDFDELVHLCSQYDMEMEVKKAKRELEEKKRELERQQQLVLAAAADDAAASMRASQPVYRGSTYLGSISAPAYGLGSRHHLAVSGMYFIANQARFMARVDPHFHPSPIQSTAMSFFR